MPAILPRKETKTDSPDWQTALVSTVFLWRYLNKRDARRAIPQGLLTHRWEVGDKHAAKQHKKLEKMQKKRKWYATIQRPDHYLQWSCYN
ncbi:unnamed protein product [Penicillium viridicatum]